MTKQRTQWMAMAGGAVVLGTALYLITQKSKPTIAFESAAIERGSLRQTVLSSGVVQPQNRLEVKAPIAGRIENILVVEGQRVKSGQVLAWMSSQERAALIDTARTKGDEELKYWEEAYKLTPIVAPLNGLIILKNTERGQTVTPADAIVVMSNHLTVRANVDETDIASIRLKQPVEITLDAFSTQSVQGHVARIAYDAKTINSVTTYEVETVPEDIPPFFKSGMTANVTFILASKEDVLSVPIGAITRQDRKNFVYVAAADGTPTLKPVELGISDGKRTENLSGLDASSSVLLPKVVGGKRAQSGGGNNPLNPFGHRGGKK